MPNQKLENLLNLALESSQEDLERSANLSVGYDSQENVWEIIVKHSQPLPDLSGQGVVVAELLNQYAILRLPEALIEEISRLPQIEFIEKPKRLYFAINQAKAASCIYQDGGVNAGAPAFTSPDGSAGILNLSGRGVIVAVIDSGIDFFHEDFRNGDGSTRILELWDQGLDRVFTREEINQALETGDRQSARSLVPSIDGSGHGTAVAGIAAGNGRESQGRYRGVAYESDLLVVKLGVADPMGFPRTTELMRALDYVVRLAAERGQPVAVNVSFGNTYGSHDGTSLLETYIDAISNYGRSSIIVGAGNEADGGGHASGRLAVGRIEEIELTISNFEPSLSVQLWKHYSDLFQVTLVAPDGTVVGVLPAAAALGPRGGMTWEYGDTRILIYYGEPGPYSMAQEIYFDFLPLRGSYLQSGIWKFRLTPERIVEGRYDLWLPSAAALNRSTYLRPSSPETTLTIPSTAAMAITVGAYNSAYQTYADFSGRGFTRVTDQVKPDLAAPGVGIMAPRRGGGYEAVTGTSFAAPIVSGAAALMMQWGIVDGNDAFLYGEKLKAYLIRGARQLPGYEVWPNPLLGWGVLCLRNSLPV